MAGFVSDRLPVRATGPGGDQVCGIGRRADEEDDVIEEPQTAITYRSDHRRERVDQSPVVSFTV